MIWYDEDFRQFEEKKKKKKNDEQGQINVQ